MTIERAMHLRNLKNTRIVVALENLPYDILIDISRQRSAVTVESQTSPERGSHTALDWMNQITINRFMRWFWYELQQPMNLGDLESATLQI
jgi:hypothetical protein